MKSVLKVGTMGLLLGGLVLSPVQGHAQNTNQPAAKKAAAENKTAPSGEKKPGAGPFHGKLAKVDKVAKAITVGKRTFQITSGTKLKKADGTPATLSDAVVGEEVSGYVKPTEDGKLVATTVTFGAKTGGQGAEKKKSAGEKDQK
jgi:hypothetical protein